MRLLFGTIAATIIMLAPLDRIRAADDPLAFIPTSSSVFIHLRAGDLLKTALFQEVRKAAAKEIDKAAADAKEELGIAYDTIDTVTFCYPNMPQGPGDEQTFVVIVTTNKPFDKDAVLKKVRKKDAKAQDNRVELQEKFILQFASDTMFLVMHKSLAEKLAKPMAAGETGVMSDALKMARDKNEFVLSVDFSKLPNELFTAAPPELQPFLPLLKSKSSTLAVNLKETDKKITANLRFINADEAAAGEAEQSFKLLMKLATRGFEDLFKNAKDVKEIGDLLPLLKEIEHAVKDVKITRDGARLEAATALNTNLPIGEMAVKLLDKYRKESGNAEELNKLRQVGLAMHQYHNMNNGFPPAAICDKKGKPMLSWRVAILPFIEQNELYKEFHLDEAWDSDHNKKLLTKIPNLYKLSGTKPDDVTTHWRIFFNNGAAFDLFQQTTMQSITDGTSNTVMVVDAAEASPWTKPDDFEFDPKTASIEKLLRFTNDKTIVVFCDGSVRVLKRGLGDKTWRLLIQKADGEPIPDLNQ